MSLGDWLLALFGFLLLLVGLLSLAQLPKALREARRDLARAQRTSGRVVRLTRDRPISPDGDPTWHPVVEFESEPGKKHTVQVRFGRTPSPWSVGDSIKIMYPPEQPSRAEVDNAFMAWQPVWIALLLSLVLGCGGALLILLAVFHD